MILAATRDAAPLFLELGTVTVMLAVGARLAARTDFLSIPALVEEWDEFRCVVRSSIVSCGVAIRSRGGVEHLRQQRHRRTSVRRMSVQPVAILKALTCKHFHETAVRCALSGWTS